MFEKSVSIIVPVYNEEKYLSKCLDSLIHQTYKNLQIIIVNDGSTDKSLEIINNYKKLDSRIISINKSNGGVSEARNAGIEKAEGEYIIFIDADDYVHLDMIEKMVTRIIKDNTDVCVCNVFRISDDEESVQSKRTDEKIIFKSDCFQEEYMIPFLLRQNVHAYCVWNKIFKRSVIVKKNIRFVSDKKIYPEDMFFNLQYFTEISSVSWIGEPLYFHLKNQNRITTSYRPDVVMRYGNCAALYREYLQKTGRWEKLNAVYYMMLNWTTINSVMSAFRDNKENAEEISCKLKKKLLEIESIDKIVNTKYYSEESANTALCKNLIFGDTLSYTKNIEFLMKNKTVNNLFTMKDKWNL